MMPTDGDMEWWSSRVYKHYSFAEDTGQWSFLSSERKEVYRQVVKETQAVFQTLKQQNPRSSDVQQFVDACSTVDLTAWAQNTKPRASGITPVANSILYFLGAFYEAQWTIDQPKHFVLSPAIENATLIQQLNRTR